MTVIICGEYGFPARIESIYLEPDESKEKGQVMKTENPLVNLSASSFTQSSFSFFHYNRTVRKRAEETNNKIVFQKHCPVIKVHGS